MGSRAAPAQGKRKIMLQLSLVGSMRVATDEAGRLNGIVIAWVDGTVQRFQTPGEAIATISARAAMRDGMAKLAGDKDRSISCILGYDLAYDLAPCWSELIQRFRLTPLAKSPGDIYQITATYPGEKRPALAFWDIRHLTPGGIHVMADSMSRPAPESPEAAARLILDYATAIQSRHAIASEDFGTRVMTLTGLARHDASKAIGARRFTEGSGERQRTRTIEQAYRQRATTEAARTYEQYALRRACNRGGLVFTAARHAGQVQGRTIAIDEASAHHAQAICRYVPERFREVDPGIIETACRRIMAMTVDDVMASYHMPFSYYFHAKIEFWGVKLKTGSVWAHEEIGTHSMARFAEAAGARDVDDDAAIEAERAIRAAGYHDEVDGGEFAYGKLMCAARVVTFLTEAELFIFCHAYEFDDFRVIAGEGTAKRRRPEDYAILTSMYFWKNKLSQKAAAKRGDTRAAALYRTETKPAYNAVGYGVHARDEFKPRYEIDEEGAWHLTPAVDAATFDERRPKAAKAWYTYGERISIGARLHLVIAIELIWRRFGSDKVRIVAGDTDSIKIATELPASAILEALEPLHRATREAIARTAARAHELFPHDYVDMAGVGEFEVEGVFKRFYSPGAKQYCTIDEHGAVDLTLAGVPHTGERSYAAWLKLMVDKYGPAILERIFAFDVTLMPDVSQLVIADYNKAYISSDLPVYAGSTYTLNDTSTPEAAASIEWQRKRGRQFDIDPQSTAAWDAAGAVFRYAYGELKA